MNASPEPACPNDPAPASRHGGVDVWERWLPAWHVYNGLVVAGTLLVVLLNSPVRTTALWVSFGVVALLVAVYLYMWILRHLWDGSDRLRITYGVFIVATFGVLVLLAPHYQFLQFALYAQVFFAMPRAAYAIIGGLVAGLLIALAELSGEAWDLGAALPAMVLGFVQATAFTLLSAWIGAIIGQSHERNVLVAQLEATRADLAAAEREAGALEERARLSREIHDTLAQGFASVVTHLEAAEAVFGADAARAREHMGAASEVARASLDESRRLVWALRPKVLEDGGLPAAIGRVAAAVPGVTVDVTISGTIRPLHPDVEVTILRAAQEGLANALRHASASRISLTLTYFDDAVSLDVIDDGSGFDPSALAAPGPAGGHGLAGMRERASGLGGTLDVESAPGEGTAIALQLPAPLLAEVSS